MAQKQRKRTAIIALSGGMDSATLLGSVIKDREVRMAVSFYYGSKHNRYENAAAGALAQYYDVPLTRIDISYLFQNFPSALLQRNREVPEGYYEGENMRQTVVPGRNLMFASILAGLAEANGIQELYLGIHAGDHHIYPDCRPEFALALAAAIKSSSDGKVDLCVPFLHIHKLQILQLGFSLKVPYHLTRTCYKEQALACGKCGSCQERLDAFSQMDVDDPIVYETRRLIPKS